MKIQLCILTFLKRVHTQSWNMRVWVASQTWNDRVVSRSDTTVAIVLRGAPRGWTGLWTPFKTQMIEAGALRLLFWQHSCPPHTSYGKMKYGRFLTSCPGGMYSGDGHGLTLSIPELQMRLHTWISHLKTETTPIMHGVLLSKSMPNCLKALLACINNA
jgi:hypothetical protein